MYELQSNQPISFSKSGYPVILFHDACHENEKALKFVPDQKERINRTYLWGKE